MLTSHRTHLFTGLTGIAGIAGSLLVGCSSPVATTDSTTEDSTGATDATTGEPTTGDSSVDPTGQPAESEARYFLRIDDDPVPPIVLELDKAKALEVFGEDAARQIKLIDVDSAPLLTEILDRIQSSCGDLWSSYDYDPQNPDDPNKPSKPNIWFPNNPNSIPSDDLPIDPGHDCTRTELGQTYGADWRHSPEFAMVRLLTMTPRNARLKGTVLEPFETLFAQYDGKVVNGFTFPDLLAASLFCGSDPNPKQCTDKLKDSQLDKNHEVALHTRPFIAKDVLAETLKLTLMASHPNIANPDGLLSVTLYDALKDMQPLSEKFGPTGDHPGLLMPDDADFTTYSDALTADFKMAAIAESNLRHVEGIDASNGAGAMFLSIAESPLNFDFMDPDKVQLLGIAPAPTVDMRMRIMEIDGTVPSCDEGLDPCLDNLPVHPLGTEYIWTQPLWSLERIIAEAAYASFRDLSYPFYCFAPGNPCAAGASIGVNPGLPGWTVFSIGIQGLDAPPPQYLWEMLLGVVQIAVHDPALDNKKIPEGDANPVFALKSVPIGLTADEMIAEIRPNLQAQAGFIANTILGKFWKNNDHLDFYYRRIAPNGPPALFFVAASDLRPDASGEALAAYNYKKPGFFADPGLTQKLSRTTLDGSDDTTHEKLRLDAGETTVYMQDDEDRIFRVRLYVGPDANEVAVHVRSL